MITLKEIELSSKSPAIVVKTNPQEEFVLTRQKEGDPREVDKMILTTEDLQDLVNLAKLLGYDFDEDDD